MRPLGVVVADVDAKDVLELATVEDQQPIEAFASERADPPFDVGVRVRCPDRCPYRLHAHVLKDAIECPALNFASRSWIRNRTRWPRSSRSIRRLRACCSIQAPSGLLLQAMYSIRRLPTWMKTSTWSRRSKTVSTV